MLIIIVLLKVVKQVILSGFSCRNKMQPQCIFDGGMVFGLQGGIKTSYVVYG